jgi:hypothetical protein
VWVERRTHPLAQPQRVLQQHGGVLQFTALAVQHGEIAQRFGHLPV